MGAAARDITAKLGGRWYGGEAGYGLTCCVAHEDHSPSLRLRDGDSSLLVHCYAGCDPLDVLAELRRRQVLTDAQYDEPRDRRPKPHEDRARGDRIGAALRLWNEAGDARGSLAEHYLGARRLALPRRHHDVLRYHKACPFKGATVPAMVALLRDIQTNEPCGIHRTPLLRDGSDRDRALGKAMLGRAHGAVIKLSPDDQVGLGLGIAEGIETTLAILEIGWRPMWSAASAGGVATFPVLAGIEEITVFADHDDAGQKAARVCAQRWCEASRLATIRYPLRIDADWCDVMRLQ